jgi:long-chain acyl-CoA synthetase
MVTANKKNAILDRWQSTLARCGDRAAVLAPDGAVLKRFAEIEADAAAFAGRLTTALAEGAVVAIRAGNSPDWPAILLACFRRGLIPLPVGRHMERAELERVIHTCGVAAVIEGTGDEFEVRASAFPPGIPPGDVDFLKLTSGTTAAPRGVAFRSGQLVADCDNVCTTMGVGPEDLNFGVIPFSHSYGFSNLITPLLCRGVALVASEDRMPRAILNGLERSGATVFPGMPVFYQAFAAMPEVPRLPALRLCISAGAPLARKVGERFSERFGKKIHTFYGSSECGGIAYDRSDAPDYEEGFVGTAMENVDVERLDDSAANSSRIAIRGEAVGEGYFPLPDEEVLGGGRFVPADLVRVGERGFYLVGRVSDVINVAGRKLNPMEVETEILRLPGVRQVVVFGVPSALRNEEPVACVAAENGLVKTALMEQCRSALSPWQVPKDIWLVESIPTNERGKVSRRELAEAYRAR